MGLLRATGLLALPGIAALSPWGVVLVEAGSGGDGRQGVLCSCSGLGGGRGAATH